MKKAFLLSITLLLFFFGIKIGAYEISKNDKLLVSGQTIGIELDTGVIVMGTYGVEVKGQVITPWADADLREGDVITSFADKKITTVDTLINELNINKDKVTNIGYLRNNKTLNSTIKPVASNNKYTLGIYIKDHMLGVGTLTYIVPNLNIFGSLGHSITDLDSYGGSIYEASVDSIVKPSKTKAGEKRASIISGTIGSIEKNTNTGIHGTLSSDYSTTDLRLMNFKTKEEVKTGKATILTCLNKENIESFEIEITKVEKQKTKDVKGIKFKVTDESLLQKTGGIVQGMSGSPIIQDGAIVGAVTHVLLNDSTVGYGIFIEFMLNDMDIYIVE